MSPGPGCGQCSQDQARLAGGAGPRPPPPLPLVSLGPRRKVLYQRAPRNIHRHVVLSEIKEAVAALPPVRERAGLWLLPASSSAPGSGSQAEAPPLTDTRVLRGRAAPAAFRDLMGLRAVTWWLGAPRPVAGSLGVRP